MLALSKLQKTNLSKRYNLGNGQGFSVKQVIDTAIEVTGKEFEVDYIDRRAGDPAILVADSSMAKQDLGWEPRFADLERIVETAWRWEQSFFG